MLQSPSPKTTTSATSRSLWLNILLWSILSVGIGLCLFITQVFSLLPALAIGFFGISLGFLMNQSPKANINVNTQASTNNSNSHVTSDRTADSLKLTKLINQQQNTYLQVFLKNPATFHQPSFHYDWWMFPVPGHAAASSTSLEYAVNDAEIAQLLQHDIFMKTYLDSIDKYLNNLSNYGWNKYPIRYEKMLRSLFCFITVSQGLATSSTQIATQQRLYDLASTAVEYAEKNNINTGRIAKLMNDVKKILASKLVSADQKALTPTFKKLSLSSSNDEQQAISFALAMSSEKTFKQKR